MSASITFSGGDAMRGRLTGLAAQAKGAIARVLYEEGHDVLRESQERVPVDLGVLKTSGFVTTPEWTGDTARVTVGYGGAASAYAAAVHEHMGIGSAVVGGGGEVGLSDFDPPSWKLAEAQGHGVHFSGGGPKFLESVLHEHEPTFAARMGANVAADLGMA